MALGYHCIVYPKVKVLGEKYQDLEKVWKSTLVQRGLFEG
jgi:hypothetical protein